MRNKNFIILSIAFIVLAVVVMNLTSAYFWACFDKGEKAYYCNDYKPPRTCTTNSGCQFCMKSYDEANNCFVHQYYEDCYTIPQECGLGGDGGGSGIDSTPPVITVSSPTQGQLFDSRKVDIGFSLDEVADVYYIDAVNGRGRWSKICDDCDTPFSKGVSFDEGQNIIILKAIDSHGNEGFSGNVSFFVDSKDPKIKKTMPKKGFADGEFTLDFQEANPSTITLFYGINGSSSINVPLSNCIPNPRSNEKQTCTIDVDLSSFNGQEISYWFNLVDIVGNSVNSKLITLEVDTTAPQITNPSEFFHYETGTKYVYFHLNITENNFDEVVYSYLDDKGRLKEKSICSRLREGACEKKVSFQRGTWHLTVSAWDDAGNSAALPADFVVDY